MSKRAIIVHGWGDSPEGSWFPWLKKELESHGFTVTVPAMPNPDEPTIDRWVPRLASVVGTPDTDAYLVGHSVGCQTILRYLQTLSGNAGIGGAVFVAPWFRLANLETEEERAVAAEWESKPIAFGSVRRWKKRPVAILSDNDPWVPLEETRHTLRQELNAAVTVLHHRGHIGGDENVRELPEALDAVLAMAEVKA